MRWYKAIHVLIGDSVVALQLIHHVGTVGRSTNAAVRGQAIYNLYWLGASEHRKKESVCRGEPGGLKAHRMQYCYVRKPSKTAERVPPQLEAPLRSRRYALPPTQAKRSIHTCTIWRETTQPHPSVLPKDYSLTSNSSSDASLGSFQLR